MNAVPPEVGVAVIGAGTRLRTLYGPLLTMLPGIRPAGIYGRDRQRSAEAATALGAVAYPDFDALLEDPGVDAVIACVTWSQNPELYRRLAAWDRPVLLETPLSADPTEAADVASALLGRSSYTDVAEQYHRRPIETIKRDLINRGVFGDVQTAYSDGVGHEYHGVSLLRSYLGQPAAPRRVLAAQRDLPMADHITHRGVFFAGERIQHAVIEFDNDTLATYHWSWLNYESPIRARRHAGFTGTRGAAWGEEMVALTDPDNPHARHYRVQRRTRVLHGVEVLAEIAVLADETCITKWHNPYPLLPLDEERITAAAFLTNLAASVTDPTIAPLYPLTEAAADHATVAAMYQAMADESGSWTTTPSPGAVP
ncbi:Gfo/Idh/MocA family oxidoreductase [Nocardia sp. NPDC047038]|uniref:Gfo/Idh/MocA family protein n=1 Tax=Nocardia sp. NPDC047038 TaxID=3154338 RepID=UPI0034087889